MPQTHLWTCILYKHCIITIIIISSNLADTCGSISIHTEHVQQVSVLKTSHVRLQRITTMQEYYCIAVLKKISINNGERKRSHYVTVLSWNKTLQCSKSANAINQFSLEGYSADVAPRVPTLKLSIYLTVWLSSGTVVPPDCQHNITFITSFSYHTTDESTPVPSAYHLQIM